MPVAYHPIDRERTRGGHKLVPNVLSTAYRFGNILNELKKNRAIAIS
jgi:hypothetical protein